MAKWTEDEIERLNECFYLSTPSELEDEFPDRNYESIRRKAYRLGLERSDNIRRISSAKSVDEIDVDSLDDGFCEFISGFVAGEGTFTKTKRPSGTTRYRFCIQLARDDSDIIYDMQEVFECGSVNEYGPRRSNEKGSVSYQINGFGQIFNRVIPFFDEYGFYSARKQRQYNSWRDSAMNEVQDRKI